MAVGTTSQPCVKEDPSNHPVEAELILPEIQEHHLIEDTTLATGASLAIPLNASATRPHPAVLSAAVHTAPVVTTMIDATRDPLPSKATSTAQK